MFKVHQFVAGGFGVALLVDPSAVLGVFGESSLPFGEAFALRSWGCFVLAVAGVAHAAPKFPLSAQRSIGRSLAGCFGLLTGLYTHAVATANLSGAYRAGIAATGTIFAALFVAYSGALLGMPAGDKGA